MWLSHKQSAVLVPVLGCLTELVHKNEVIAEQLYRSMTFFIWRITKSVTEILRFITPKFHFYTS